MQRLPILLALGLLAGCAGTRPVQPAAQAPYDLLIRNGLIVDGTGSPWVRGDVAIRGDRIAAVGRLPGARALRSIRRPKAAHSTTICEAQ